MAEPRIAQSLGRLREQVQQLFPNAPKSEFGWIGDQAHRNRVSDHNPDSLGIVHALDIPHLPGIGLDTYELAAHFRDIGNAGNEPRLKYVISNRRIWNPSISKAWRAYNGANAHDQHVHVSVVGGNAADDARDWDLGDLGRREPDAVTSKPLLQRGASGSDVRLIQQALMIDGIFGPLTEQAVRRFQALEEIDDDGIVGPLTWRALQFRFPELFVELPPPPPGTSEWQTDITATVFGGSREHQTTAYDEHVITDDEFTVAYPFRFPYPGKLPIIQVHNVATNKAVNANVGEVGPWMEDDDYAQKGTRPIAETCYKNKTPLPRGPHKGKVPTNPSGLDLSPAVARAVGIDGMGRINWRFV